MANFMSSVLDELMGRNRNALPDEQPKALSWDDPEICTQYLVSFCPNELFVNTKADLGPCIKIHDDQLRKRYVEEAPNYQKIQFENEFMRFADKMIQDIEAKIKRGKMRIALANGPDGGTYAGPGSKNAEKIAFLTDRVNVLLKEAEEAGCGGDVEKAQGLMKLCDQLKEEREQMKSNEVNHPWNPDKAMQVCEVCGSYLIIGEAQHRLDDHIMGKQHIGFAMLRKTMDDVQKARELREVEERERIEKERLNRRFGGGNGGGAGRDRGRDREIVNRDRDRRDRDRTDKKRSRSRSRDRKKKEERRRRSGSRSRDRKDRKRDRDSSRDKSRKSRRHSDDKDKDRDKDKKRSKRSRSRSRSRDSKHRRHRSRSGSRSRDRKRKGDERGDKERKHSESKEKDELTPSKSPTSQSPKKKDEETNVPTSIGEDSSSRTDDMDKRVDDSEDIDKPAAGFQGTFKPLTLAGELSSDPFAIPSDDPSNKEFPRGKGQNPIDDES